MPDQPQASRGSTADYCSRWPGEPHAISVHMRGGTPSVRRCDACGWIDHTDLQEQVVLLATELAAAQLEEAYTLGLAEGRRQTTEGWHPVVDHAKRLNKPMLARLRKCAADTSSNWDGAVTVYPPETRGLVALIDAVLAVDPWKPAEQPEAAQVHIAHVPQLPDPVLDEAAQAWAAAGNGDLRADLRRAEQLLGAAEPASGGVVEPTALTEPATSGCVRPAKLEAPGVAEKFSEAVERFRLGVDFGVKPTVWAPGCSPAEKLASLHRQPHEEDDRG